jgi:hypothetical protein
MKDNKRQAKPSETIIDSRSFLRRIFFAADCGAR